MPPRYTVRTVRPRPVRPDKDRAVLDRLGMTSVRLVFPSPEEWADPALLLRRAYAPPEAV